MQTEELIDLTNWVIRNLENKEIHQLYEALYNAINSNSRPNQPRQPFQSERDQLLSALKSIPVTELSHGQIEVIQKLGFWETIGDRGAEIIEDTLYRNSLDIATAANEINSSLQKIKKGLEWSNQINNLLYQITEADDVLEEEGTALMRVTFAGSAQMSNLSEFKSWGKAWFEIGRGIAMANSMAPEDIRITGASKGSVILVMAGAYVIVKTLSMIMLEFLKVAEQTYKVRTMAEELRKLQLQNNETIQRLEEDAKTIRDKGISKIADKMTMQCQLDKPGDGDKALALKKSIETIANFIDKGGEIDIVLPEDSEQDEDDEQAPIDPDKTLIRNMLSEIRALDSKVRMIEHKE